jgi:hypothetical protein
MLLFYKETTLYAHLLHRETTRMRNLLSRSTPSPLSWCKRDITHCITIKTMGRTIMPWTGRPIDKELSKILFFNK